MERSGDCRYGADLFLRRFNTSSARLHGGGKIHDLALAAFYSSLCILTKNEGLPIALINVFILLFFHSIPNRDIKCLLTYVSIMIIPCIPWFVFLQGIPKIHEHSLTSLNLAHFTENIERLEIILPAFFREYLNLRNWGIFWIMTGILCFSGWKHLKNKMAVALIFLFILHTSLYVFIYLVYPYSLDWLLTMSLERLILHTAPAILLILTYLSPVDENP